MVFEAESVQSFLMSEFRRRIRSNSRYSLRAFSRDLGLAPGALSEILRDQRLLSLKSAAKIAKLLGLNESEAKRLFELAEADRRKAHGKEISETLKKSSTQQTQLDEDTFNLISEWQNFAILNLIDCEGFQWKASHIAKRLGITVAQAQTSMNFLLKLGLVQQKGNSVKGTQDYVLSPAGIPSAAVRNYHKQMLEKALHALEVQSIHDREMSGVGFAFDPNRLPQIKQEINDFQDQLIAKYSKGKRHEVYFLELALFRLTHGEYNEKK